MKRYARSRRVTGHVSALSFENPNAPNFFQGCTCCNINMHSRTERRMWKMYAVIRRDRAMILAGGSILACPCIRICMRLFDGTPSILESDVPLRKYYSIRVSFSGIGTSLNKQTCMHLYERGFISVLASCVGKTAGIGSIDCTDSKLARFYGLHNL